MIRHSIICDICGVERKLANHWFTAQEHDGEFRIGAFLQSKSVRPGLKHLCGQTCLHRLVDDFLVRHMGGRTPLSPTEEKNSQQRSHLLLPNLIRDSEAGSSRRGEQSSFDSANGLEPLDDFESSAVLIPTPASKKHLNGSGLAVPIFESRPPGARKKAQTSIRNASKASQIANASCALPSSSRRVPGAAQKTSERARAPKPEVRSKSPGPQQGFQGQMLLKSAEPATKTLAVESQVRTIAAAQVVPPPGPVTPGLPASPAASIGPVVSVGKVSSAGKSTTPSKTPPVQSATMPRTPDALPTRTLAGAWERARLWESRSSHLRQAPGKK